MVFLFLLPLACYWVLLIHQLGAQWSLFEQYSYGWAVPFLCLYILWQRWPSRPGAQPSRWSLRGTFLLGLLLLLLLPVRVLHEANPIWRLTSLGWALILVTLTLAVLWRVGGSPWVRHFCPPICFFLVAVPWPTSIESAVVQGLMRLNVGITVEILQFLGIPALQKGNVVEVATGSLGIEEACSGIRSIQATLMISLFFGILYRLPLKRAAALVVSGVGLAFCFNVIRTSLLSWVAALRGISAISAWHDPAGVAILVACFLSLWGCAVWLKRRQGLESGVLGLEFEGHSSQSIVHGPQSTVHGPLSTGRSLDGKAETLKAEMLKSDAAKGRTGGGAPGFSVSGFQRFSIFLIAWLVLVEGGTELWYRSHERASVRSAEWSVQGPGPNPGDQKVPIPSGVRGQFQSDDATQLRWRDDGGNSWQLYYFRWLPAHSLKRRLATLLAKTHGPEICLPAAGMSLKSDLGIITVPMSGMELALQSYVFSAEGKAVHVFYGIYEDPTGSAVLANRRQNTVSRIKAALAGSRNSGQRWLEVAVVGCESPEDAKAALVRELGKVIKPGA